tara:strand:- start:1030 stop:1503 length:474 start_codon:yes stop_codon:yes gene_type:complete
MNKLLLFLIIPFCCFSQKHYAFNIDEIYYDSQIVGCVDLDETLLDLVSIFGDTSLLDGLLGCTELIPVLESGLLSAFLPFDIPLDCNTDLTPFGYLDMNVSDVCECSCQKHLEIPSYNLTNRKLIKKISVLGLEATEKGLRLEIYNDGSVEKKYLIK